MIKPILSFVLMIYAFMAFAQGDAGVTVIPQPYEKALKNPLMGFTTINVDDHPWICPIINIKPINYEKTN